MKKNNKTMPKKIAILYSDAKKEYFPSSSEYLTEKNAKRDAGAVGSYIKKMGIQVELIAGNAQMVAKLNAYQPDLVLNLVDSFRGSEMAATVIPCTLELLNYKYSGVGYEGCAYYSKFLCNDLLLHHGISVPKFQLISAVSEIKNNISFPIITKLNEIHGAVEVTRDSISRSLPHLKKRAAYLLKKYQQSVLAEKFIIGNEVTTFLLEEEGKINVFMGIKEFPKQSGDFQFADFDSQWKEEGTVFYQKYINQKLEKIMVKIFKITKMRDYGKIDIRLDRKGKYYVIDVNHNPFLGPKEIESPMATILEMYNIDFDQIISKIIRNAFNRK